MANTSPAFSTVTPNDHSAGVTVTNIVLILFSGIVVIAKTLIRFKTATVTSLDNLAIFSALAFAIAQSICVQLAINHGLGKHQRSVSPSDFIVYSKSNYAALILYVFTLGCTKLSVAQLIVAIQPQKSVLLATRIVVGVIGLWTISSVFALAFECHLPNPWLVGADRCVNLQGLFDYIGVINILTDIALIILPVPMMWKIQIAMERKLLVLALFAVRIVLPAIVIVQLVYFHDYVNALNDQTWSNTTPWIVTQVMMNLSIITACVPSLRRVVTELRTHQTGLAISEGMEFGTMRSGEKTHTTANSGSHNTRTVISQENTTQAEEDESQIPYGHNPPNDRVRKGSAQISSGKRSPAWQKDDEDRTSQERLRENSHQITRTVDYSVEEDQITKSSTEDSIEYHAM